MSDLKQIELEQTLMAYEGDDRVLPAEQVLKIYRDERPKGAKIMSKIPTLDKTVGGFFPGQLVVVSGITGHGKCHGKGTKIRLHNGTIKPVEDIVEGDLLMGDDNTPRKVLSITRGFGDLYRITSKKGSDYVVNEDHILCLKRTRGNKFRKDKTTPRKDRKGEIQEISVKDYLTSSAKFRHFYKGYRVAVDYPQSCTDIEAYFLGLWLGDGHSASVRVTNADQEVEDYLFSYAERLNLRLTIFEQPNNNKSRVYAITGVKGAGKSLQSLLRTQNLLDNKHIPTDYKITSRERRLELLAGIIDSDGYVNPPCGYEIVLKNKQLAEDIIDVCLSLGLCAYKIKPRLANGTEYHRVTITGDIDSIPVKVERKKVPPRQQKKDVSVAAIRVDRLGVGDYYGFELDGNGRYLLADYTVTHNTTLCQTFTRNMAEQLTMPLWFSYEVSTEDFLSIFPHDHLKYIHMPLKLKDNTLKWLEERMLESKVKFRTTAVFIDHVHYLVQMNGKQNMSFVIGECVRGLKQLAIKHNLVVFLIAHMQKTKPDEEPALGHTRDSSFIEQEADTVLYVWRHSKDKWVTICKVAKNRKRGIIDSKIGMVLKDGQYFETSLTEEQNG